LPLGHLAELWQITGVPDVRPRIDSQYWPLLARGVVLALCALLSALRPGPSLTALAPALLLLLVAALGTVPLPDAVPPWLQPVAETLAAALVVGSLQGRADFFLPYLLIPLATAGLNAGLATGLLAAGTTSVVFVLTTRMAAPVDPTKVDPTTWVPMFVSVALVAAWMRRVVRIQPVIAEPAYTDAHRLLSELHVVARQLSLGLDPQTLAAALVDELRAVVETATGTVLVRSPGGRFVPLVGDMPSALAESVVLDAWLSGHLVRRSREGLTVAALPVLMGERVVAVVILTDENPMDDVLLASCLTAVGQAGPRLASALLFDDVRRLATVDERMRLAREIHDGIAQDMASVGYVLDDVARDAPGDVAMRLMQLREHLGGLVGDLRLSIFDLRAGVDENVGLARTLGEYVTRVGGQAGLVVHVTTDESPHRLPVATEVELLRIVQEAVTNVRRHAGATNLWLTVAVNPPRATVTISDDGRGLQPRRADSMGITGMKERARRIGADLTVGPRPDARGTMVKVVIEPQRVPVRRTPLDTPAATLLSVADSAHSVIGDTVSASNAMETVGARRAAGQVHVGPGAGGDR
jgi:signal transduction histidine kinase